MGGDGHLACMTKPVISNSIWDEKCEAIEAAYREAAAKAPMEKSPRTSKAIPYELAIPGMGRELMLMMSGAPRKLLPPKKALAELRKTSDGLLAVLDLLPPEAAAALDMSQKTLPDLRLKLRVLSEEAKAARIVRKAGPPEKVQATKIARAVAVHYYHFMGRNPSVPKREGKAYGPYLNLLSKIFKILELKASAESQAEKVVRNWQPPEYGIRTEKKPPI